MAARETNAQVASASRRRPYMGTVRRAAGRRFDRIGLADLIEHARPGNRLCVTRLDTGRRRGACLARRKVPPDDTGDGIAGGIATSTAQTGVNASIVHIWTSGALKRPDSRHLVNTFRGSRTPLRRRPRLAGLQTFGICARAL